MGIVRSTAPALAGVLLLVLSCAGPTSVTIVVSLEAGTPVPDALVVDVDGPTGPVLEDYRAPDPGESLQIPWTLVMQVGAEPAQLQIQVRAIFEGVVVATGVASVLVRPHRDTRVAVLLGASAGTDAGLADGGDSASSGDAAIDGGNGLVPPPPSVVCPPGGMLWVVTTAYDEQDGPASSTTVAGIGGPYDVSLREAINLANHVPGPDEIRFDPGVFPTGALRTILVGGGSVSIGLPELLDDGICIDGAGAEVIIMGSTNLDDCVGLGLDSCSGLRLASADNVVANLTIVSFPTNGILVTSPAVRSVVRDCHLGVAGIAAFGNSNGIKVSGSAVDTVIGPGNVVGANLDGGIVITGTGTTGTVVIGNYIGVEPTLFGDIGNGGHGLTGASSSCSPTQSTRRVA